MPHKDPKARKEYHKKYYQKNKEHWPTKDQVNLGGHRQTVLARSDGKCVKCGNVAEVVHHLDGDGYQSLDPLDKWIGIKPGHDPERMEALCRACHAKTHGGREKMHEAWRKKPGQWSKYHDKCVECSNTESPYHGDGLCNRCYQRKYYHKPGLITDVKTSAESTQPTNLSTNESKDKYP